jgi:hypothetical protein
MSFSDRAILWLHIVAAIFTLGPVTAAIMSTPRYIRKRNRVVVGYLCRVTEIYTIASVLVLVFGLILTQLLREFSKPWVSASITLYVVAVVLLVLIIRDQRKAMTALAAAEAPGVATARSGEAETGTGSQGQRGTAASQARRVPPRQPQRRSPRTCTPPTSSAAGSPRWPGSPP